jgi:hypothetical protein
MALQTSGPFASFDITDGSQIRDISATLEEALLFDFHFLEHIQRNILWNDPAEDPQIWWNEDALNPDTVTLSAASAASTATTLNLASGHGLRVHVGDYLVDQASGSTEVIQVTAIATDALTVVRTINSTVAASITTSATLSLQRVEQESSDISADKTVAPTVRSNYMQIIAGAFELQISGRQLARRMATDALKDQVAHQIANRSKEFKRSLTRSLFYSERVGPGTDSAYASMGGLRYWIRDNGGVVNSTSGALLMLGSASSTVDSMNKTIVDQGEYPDTFVIGTDLVNSVNSTDSSNRRMLESEVQAGYMVQGVRLAQGNVVDIIVDPRCKPGDFFLLCKDKINPKPFIGRGMFTIAATDFTDATKRRLLGDWSLELRNPTVHGYGYSKT